MRKFYGKDKNLGDIDGKCPTLPFVGIKQKDK
jgi:hypothetical protein